MISYNKPAMPACHRLRVVITNLSSQIQHLEIECQSLCIQAQSVCRDISAKTKGIKNLRTYVLHTWQVCKLLVILTLCWIDSVSDQVPF